MTSKKENEIWTTDLGPSGHMQAWIEKSAYDALAKELGRLNDWVKYLESSDLDRLKEIVEAKAEIENLKNEKWPIELSEAGGEIDRLNKQLASARAEIKRIQQSGFWGRAAARLMNDVKSQSALIERCAKALRSLVGFEPFQGLEPRIASEMLAEIASFKKGEK